MQLSFSTLGTPNHDISEIIGLAVKHGFDGLELRAVSGTADLMNLPAFRGQGLAETRQAIRRVGLEVICVGTGVRFSKADSGSRQENLEQAKAFLFIAQELGCPYIRIFGGPLVTTQGYGESIRWIREGFEALSELAAGFGVMPLLELHDDFSTSARAGELLDGIPGIGVIWDILHSYRFGEAFADTYAALGDRIRHVHVKDAHTYSARGFDLSLPGEGTMPIADCLDLLQQKGYGGYLSFEWEKMWHPELPEPEIALPRYMQMMRELGWR